MSIDSILDSMRQYWGYSGFRPLQRESMQAICDRCDSLTVLPTGGGKSLCYQAPAVSFDGMAVVVSPLIALMKDQVDALTECGVPAAFINSSLSTEERLQVAQRVRNRELKLLFAAPERLVQPRTLDFLREVDVSFIAIDEAHCISNWGHDFRPEYRQLGCLKSAFPNVSIHAFTATATEQVRSDIVEQLSLNDAQVLVGSFDRPNLLYRVQRREDVLSQIREVIDRHPKESGVIYCISRSSVEETAATLKSLGYSALPYHAGLSAEERRKHQEAFISEAVDIIVATVAFGMGIDKSNVRYVIHAEMPRSIEAYQQESGRAGRDGLEAECCLIYSGQDVRTWEFLISQSENEENREVSLQALTRMQAFCSSVECRHRQLVSHFGQTLESANCGACDVCLEEVSVLEDSKVTAQKILSSVYRQEQRFGAEYTAQVLRGSKSQKVTRNGHHLLSTWGLLKDEPESVVRNWIDQLIAQGHLLRSGEHSVLVISESGRCVLRGEVTPTLTRPRRKSSVGVGQDQWAGVDRGLFESLRSLRHELAQQRGVPPYVILGDVSLRQLAAFRPTKPSRLLRIYGIGQQKLEEFGMKIVAEIARYSAEHQLGTDLPIPQDSPSERQRNQVSSGKSAGGRKAGTPRSPSVTGPYFDLFDEGLNRDEVALQLNRAVSTVSQYLVDYVYARNLSDPAQWIPAALVTRIEDAIDKVTDERLKPIFEELQGTVSYEDIRLVIACRNIRERQQSQSS